MGSCGLGFDPISRKLGIQPAEIADQPNVVYIEVRHGIEKKITCLNAMYHIE